MDAAARMRLGEGHFVRQQPRRPCAGIPWRPRHEWLRPGSGSPYRVRSGFRLRRLARRPGRSACRGQGTGACVYGGSTTRIVYRMSRRNRTGSSPAAPQAVFSSPLPACS